MATSNPGLPSWITLDVHSFFNGVAGMTTRGILEITSIVATMIEFPVDEELLKLYGE